MQMEQHGSARDYGTRFLNASEDNEGLAFRFSVAFKHSLSGVAGSSLSDANREKKIKDVADRLHHLFGGNQQQPTFGHLIIVVQHIGPCRRATRSTSCEVCAKCALCVHYPSRPSRTGAMPSMNTGYVSLASEGHDIH